MAPIQISVSGDDKEELTEALKAALALLEGEAAEAEPEEEAPKKSAKPGKKPAKEEEPEEEAEPEEEPEAEPDAGEPEAEPEDEDERMKLKEAMRKLMANKGRDAVKTILTKYKATSITDIADKYVQLAIKAAKVANK